MINAVLAAIPNYFMACFEWPTESLQKLNKILRAFLWQGISLVNGGHCLVTWDTVILPKENGGLGVRDLQAHIAGMICRFTSKILQETDVPCFSWFVYRYCRHSIPQSASNSDTPMWRCFKASVPMVVESTACSLGNGATILFWYDELMTGLTVAGYDTLSRPSSPLPRTSTIMLLRNSREGPGISSYIQTSLHLPLGNSIYFSTALAILHPSLPIGMFGCLHCIERVLPLLISTDCSHSEASTSHTMI